MWRLTCFLWFHLLIAPSWAGFNPGDGALRLDLVFSGNHEHERVALHGLTRDPVWAGTVRRFPSIYPGGDYQVEMWDAVSGECLYQAGFNTLFKEWQTTAEAKCLHRAFEHCVTLPMPSAEVKILIFRTLGISERTKIFQYRFEPGGINVRKITEKSLRFREIHISKPASEGLDILFVSEGYVEMDSTLFYEHAQAFAGKLLMTKPFDGYLNQINIRAAFIPSASDGVSDPEAGVWKQTLPGSQYNTLGSERYLMATRVFDLKDAIAAIPHDQICILVNEEKYGGGGIYNHLNATAARNPHALEVFIHEFGHSLAGLADEYEGPGGGYVDYYPLDIEPWEKNITTLVSFEQKWASKIDPGTPVPTPLISGYPSKVGVFEGAGYSEKGVYRPYPVCFMRSLDAGAFCPVCQDIIAEVLLRYSDSEAD
jgi:hypothetical protein